MNIPKLALVRDLVNFVAGLAQQHQTLNLANMCIYIERERNGLTTRYPFLDSTVIPWTLNLFQETIQPDTHTPGSPLPASIYAADVGYLVDGSFACLVGFGILCSGLSTCVYDVSVQKEAEVNARPLQGLK